MQDFIYYSFFSLFSFNKSLISVNNSMSCGTSTTAGSTTSGVSSTGSSSLFFFTSYSPAAFALLTIDEVIFTIANKIIAINRKSITD